MIEEFAPRWLVGALPFLFVNDHSSFRKRAVAAIFLLYDTNNVDVVFIFELTSSHHLIAQFLEVAFLLRDVGTRGSALVLRWGRGGPERSEQENAAQACGEGDRAEGMQRAGAIGAGTFHGD